MAVKLVRVESTVEEDVTFGTCELCMSTRDLYLEYLIFEDDNGETLEIETGYWDWGDYSTFYHFENIARFGQYIKDKYIPTLKELEENFETIYYDYLNSLYRRYD